MNFTKLLPLGTLLALSLPAQIQGPQLGYVSRDGQLRRIEGLSLSSRLSAPLDLGGLTCSRISAAPGTAMRWALCATDDATTLMDLSGELAARKVADAPFDSAVWSPNGQALLLDGMRIFNLAAKQPTIESASRDLRAISDAGAVAADVAAFDGEAQLALHESTVRRFESGKAEEVYTLDFAPTLLAASPSSDAILAAAGQRLARISRTSGDIAYFDLPVAATALRLLADGSVLIADPAPGEPGWLFRWNRDEGGSVRFVPGIPVEEAALEVRQ
ncbi:hypothetical protein F183_A16430 [Bryobacterales bacterium F-183]|nr:hypothetical protein F183_A16430 [Bryobacterales bacterium F-183]